MEANNMAAMREALEDLMKFTCNCCQERYCEEDVEEEDGQRIPSPCSVIIKARDALNLGRRNCDVGTPDEWYERHSKWCANERCKDCAATMCRKCLADFLNKPYKQEGGAE